MTLRILFQLSKEDEPYINLLKGVFANTDAAVSLSSATPETVTEVLMRMREKKCSCVVTTSPKLVQLLLSRSGAKLPSLDNYAGNILEFKGVEFLVLPPIKHIVAIPYGKFLYARYLSKLLAPQKWMQLPEFTWEVFNPVDTDDILDEFYSADFIAVDIETGHEDARVITCVGFTAITLSRARSNSSSSSLPIARTLVVPVTDTYNLAMIGAVLSLSCPKVFQNGKYDNAYLLRYGLPTYNWCGDTLNLFHSWLSELPKDLAFISSFTLRKWQFWKDEAATTDLQEYYRYNAKDCFATAMSWLSLLREVPAYAWENYYKEFPLVFPCLLAEMTGLAVDREAFSSEEARFTVSLELQLASLRRVTATPNFNPSSPIQVKNLFAVMGSEDLGSTDTKSMDKFGDRHPLNKFVAKKIVKYREDRKMVGTYLRSKDSRGREVFWHDRLFYSLNPHATDTGRLASRESAFWCGQNMQNWPRDREDIEVKNGIVADDGFYFGECDYAQNEARGTAYLSGDTALIDAVDDVTRDFHGINASRFFGVPYEKIVSSLLVAGVWTHKTLDKELRNNIGKRINHGANYNMGPQVMLDTMTIDNVRRAQKLLQLPENWSLLRVTAHLLELFDNAYPVVRGAWYDKCVNAVIGSGQLVGPTGWTRKCFGNPKSNKHWLNAYVAHPPQSLAAMQLNTGYLRVFSEVALLEPVDFKLGPQIHDSILFQYRKGRTDLVWKVADCMRVPVEVVDTFGKKRTLIVPVDVKGEEVRWSKLKPLVRAPALLTIDAAAQ